MSQEIILCGLRFQVPLPPTDRVKVEKITKGLGLLAARAAKIPRFLMQPGDLEILDGLGEIQSIGVCLLDADRASAAPSSPTPKKR